jgi:hypothetical protein
VNVIFEKIWIDDNPNECFFQIRITANNSKIWMTTDVYSDEFRLHMITDGIKDLLETPFEIAFGDTSEDNDLDGIILRFAADKKSGHVGINIFMKTHIGNNIQRANFDVFTDLASLDEFALSMEKIINGEIGTVVSLSDEQS